MKRYVITAAANAVGDLVHVVIAALADGHRPGRARANLFTRPVAGQIVAVGILL